MKETPPADQPDQHTRKPVNPLYHSEGLKYKICWTIKNKIFDTLLLLINTILVFVWHLPDKKKLLRLAIWTYFQEISVLPSDKEILMHRWKGFKIAPNMDCSDTRAEIFSWVLIFFNSCSWRSFIVRTWRGWRSRLPLTSSANMDQMIRDLKKPRPHPDRNISLGVSAPTRLIKSLGSSGELSSARFAN